VGQIKLPKWAKCSCQTQLSSGACLVCSGEIANKPFYRGNFVDDRNVVIIADPKDRDSLASRLGSLIRDRDRTRAVGLQGRQLAVFLEDELCSFDVTTKLFVTELERLAAQ
jgi:hypothetical protein